MVFASRVEGGHEIEGPWALSASTIILSPAINAVSSSLIDLHKFWLIVRFRVVSIGLLIQYKQFAVCCFGYLFGSDHVLWLIHQDQFTGSTSKLA